MGDIRQSQICSKSWRQLVFQCSLLVSANLAVAQTYVSLHRQGRFDKFIILQASWIGSASAEVSFTSLS